MIGKIVAFPIMKEAVSRNTKVVSFFKRSHYWGGQLEQVAAANGLTRGLKTHADSRWYTLILQALSVRDHQ